MKNNIFVPKYIPKYQYLVLQGKSIEEHFSYLSCSIKPHANILCCCGELQPSGVKETYHIQLEYAVGKEPLVTIKEPWIVPCKEIHMYPNYTLCLSYGNDVTWTESTPVYQFTIPWITEWIIYYELYRINGGIWEGPESPSHLRERDMRSSL